MVTRFELFNGQLRGEGLIASCGKGMPVSLKLPSNATVAITHAAVHDSQPVEQLLNESDRFGLIGQRRCRIETALTNLTDNLDRDAMFRFRA